MDYSKLAKEIIKGVGSKDNVVSVTHCVTRVRFVLKDESKADDEAIKNLKGVINLVKQGGQYQVVIGPAVGQVYDAIMKIGHFDEGVQVVEEKKPEGNIFNRLLGLISSIFIPVLGLLCGGGMIKALLSLCTITGLLTTKDGTYIILSALGDVLFYFFPVVIGWSAAKKFKLPSIYGMALGGFLVYPTIVSAASGKTHTLFSGTIFALKYQLTFLGIPVALQSYASTVIPIIIICWFAGYVYRFFDKHIPDVIKMVFVPFCTLIVAGIVSLIVIGPIALVLQNILSDTVLALVGFSKGIAGFFLGAFWSILVMFGLHWAIIPFFAIDVAKYGYDVINPLIFSGGLAVLGSAIGIAIRTKDKDTKAMSTAASVSAFFGVNEPALYGVLIPRKWVMITSFASAGIGGAIAGFTGSKLYSFGASGILGLPCFINPKGIDMGFIGLCLSGVVAFVLALVSALIIGDRREDAGVLARKKEEKTTKHTTLYAPVKGEAIDLTQVNDQVFSQLMMGDGLAIVPQEERVYALCDGVVRVAYPTGHAVGIVADSGEEVLIHIGIDTVNLNGKYFTSHVSQGMRVKKGDLLVEFDLDAIKKEGYDPTVMVIVTKTDNLKNVTAMKHGDVQMGDSILDVALSK